MKQSKIATHDEDDGDYANQTLLGAVTSTTGVTGVAVSVLR